jgi:heat shock protein HslJ
MKTLNGSFSGEVLVKRILLRMTAVVILILVTALYVSSEARAQSGPMLSIKKFPFDVQWIAVSLNNKPFAGDRSDRPTLSLDETLRVRGFGACNTYSATAYPLQQQRFAVGPVALTKRECSKEMMAVEKMFLLALRTAQQWDTDEGRLIISGESGQLVFERTF